MTDLTCVAWGNRSPSFSAWAAIVLGVGLAVAPTLGFAETQVRGNPNAVSVEAKDASVEEILVALTNAFDVHFRSSANLEKKLTGTYEGTLQQVVTHVLRGYNFVVKSGEKGVEITLLGSGKTIAVGGASSASKVVERLVDAMVPTPPAADAAVRPMPVASTGPMPTIKLADGPAPAPSPAPSASGSAPSPVPGPGTVAAPSPAPPAPGSAPAAAPQLAFSDVPPSPIAGTELSTTPSLALPGSVESGPPRAQP